MADRHVDYLLVGGGLASANCARWLRESGADGSILLVGREPDPPYNRPDCSKGYLQGKEGREDTFFRPLEWYSEQQVELLRRVSVTRLSPGERRAELSDRSSVVFERALLATGANVRRLQVPGCELAGIHYLRTLANSEAIRQDAAGKRVVLIGGSYIACEVAASLTEQGSSCTLLMLEEVTLSRTFGERAGRFFQERLQDHGIQVHGGDALERFEGADGRVTRVISRGGLELEADAVVVGAGVLPDVTLARQADPRAADPRRALGRGVQPRQDGGAEHARPRPAPRRGALLLLRPLRLGLARVRRPGAELGSGGGARLARGGRVRDLLP